MSSGACLSLFVNVSVLRLFLTFLFSWSKTEVKICMDVFVTILLLLVNFFDVYESYPLN